MAKEDKDTQGETPEKPAETVEPVQEPTQKSSDVKPAANTDEEWDSERAMNTIKQLRDFEKQAKKELKELETLRAEKQEREEAEMTELEKAQKRIADLEAQAADAQKALWQRDAAAKANLPSEFVDRVRGETLEEMLEDAKKLAEALPKHSKPSLSPTNPANGEKAETLAEKKQRLFGRQGQNYFDIDNVMQSGGGVLDVVQKGSKGTE